jgi:hypothetical protein
VPLGSDSSHMSSENKVEGKGDSVKEEDSHGKEKENSEEENGGSGKKRKREEETTEGIEGTSNDKTEETAAAGDIKERDTAEVAVVSTGETVSTGAAESEEDVKMGVDASASSLITHEESSEITVKTDGQKDENKVGQKEVDKLKFTAPKIVPVSTVRAVPQRHLYTERYVRALDVLLSLTCVHILSRRM